MILSSSLRRFVAGTVAVLFLACQGMPGVHAGARDSQQAGTAQGSCHDSGQQFDKPPVQSDCQVNCASQITSTQSGATVFDSSDLSVVALRSHLFVAIAKQTSRIESPLLRVEPPPLAILHCCLRN